jgi:hypothetical protein
MCTFSVILSIVRSFSGGTLTSDGSMVAVRSSYNDMRVGEEVEVRVRKEESSRKMMITYPCPLQAPPSPQDGAVPDDQARKSFGLGKVIGS